MRPRVSGNREKALLSSVFSYAIPWGVASDNPCRLVKRNPEKPRDRYVEDAEYKAVYALASPMIQCAMDLASFIGLRQGDIINLKFQDLREEGIYVVIGKTKKKMIFEWTPELMAVVERAKSLQFSVRSMFLICNQYGQKYTSNGFQSSWQRLIVKALLTGLISERFTFHDLRGKAASEARNAHELLGHDDPRTTNRIYKRGPKRVTKILDKS